MSLRPSVDHSGHSLQPIRGLGYLTPDRLVILRPRKEPEIQLLEPTLLLKPVRTDAELIKEAIAWYQFSSDAFSQGRMKLHH